MGNMKEKTITILGCDSSHAAEFIKNILILNSRYNFNLKVISLWDKNIILAKALALKYSIEFYTDNISKALKGVDVILVANRFGEERYEIAKQSLIAEKPTFLDKPITMNLQEAKNLKDFYEAKSIKLFSASAFRFSNEVQELKKIFKDEKVLSGTIIGPYECNDLGEDPRLKNIFFYGIHLVEIFEEIFSNHFLKIDTTKIINGNSSTIELNNGSNIQLNMLRMKADYYSISLCTENKIYNKTINLNGNYYLNMLKYFFEYIDGENLGLDISKTISALSLLFKIDSLEKNTENF